MDCISEIKACEEKLRIAMLAGDVKTLASLIDDCLIFTGPDGAIINKERDLFAHESGLLKLTKIEFKEASHHEIGDVVIVTAKACLSGSFDRLSIEGVFSYTRVWSRMSGDWRVIVGHASAVG